MHTSFGLRSLNEAVRAMADLVGPWREKSWASSPAVLVLDALWMRVQRSAPDHP